MESDVRRVFRSLSIRWHPDKNPNDLETAQRRFASLCEAYEVLSNCRMRSAYDRYGKRGILWDFSGWCASSPHDVFKAFFEEFGGWETVVLHLRSPGAHTQEPRGWQTLMDELEAIQKLNTQRVGEIAMDVDPWDEKGTIRPCTRGSFAPQTPQSPASNSRNVLREFKASLGDVPSSPRTATANTHSKQSSASTPRMTMALMDALARDYQFNVSPNKANPWNKSTPPSGDVDSSRSPKSKNVKCFNTFESQAANNMGSPKAISFVAGSARDRFYNGNTDPNMMPSPPLQLRLGGRQNDYMGRVAKFADDNWQGSPRHPKSGTPRPRPAACDPFDL